MYNKFLIGLVVFLLLVIGCENRESEDFLANAEFRIREALTIPNPDSLLSHSKILNFFERLADDPDSSTRQTRVDSFFNTLSTSEFPLTDGSNLAYFIYRSSEPREVYLTGDFNKWEWHKDQMVHIPATDLYYNTMLVAADTRLEYMFIIDGIKQHDPGNPNISDWGDFSRSSVLAMPEYIPPQEIEEHNIPHGTINTLEFTDTQRKKMRRLWVYLPPGYIETDERYPTMYFHDGLWYQTWINAPRIIDNLIAQQKIKPLIGVFVEPRNRYGEYFCDEVFLSIFCDEIVPFIDERFRTRHNPLERGIAGFSMGGLGALYIVYMRHDVIGNCGAYSPAIHGADLHFQFMESDAFEARIYIDAGTYEDWIYEPSLMLAKELQAHGFDGRFFGWNEYHNTSSWRAHLDEALQYFFPVR